MTDAVQRRSPDTASSAHSLPALAGRLAQPKLVQFCKQFCYDNRRRYRCTVDESWGLSATDAALCEWGNASYLWMVDELAGERRLASLHAKGVVSIEGYWHKLLNSLPFYERFKDWRFRRRIRVPAYIKALDADAHRIFWFLCDGDTAPNIAQRLQRSEEEVTAIAAQIQRELHRRNRSELLDPRAMVSLTRWDDDEFECEQGLPDPDLSPDEQLFRMQINVAYQQLTWQEQWVIDAMVVENLSARAVLTALIEQGVALDGETPPTALNIQNVYYFLRKALTKLRGLVDPMPEVGL